MTVTTTAAEQRASAAPAKGESETEPVHGEDEPEPVLDALTRRVEELAGRVHSLEVSRAEQALAALKGPAHGS